MLSSFAHAVSTEEIRAWMQLKNQIVMSEPVKLNKLDPIFSSNAHTKFTLPLIYESLVTINADQELQPSLAQSWQIASNNKSITITIQPNHHFSDGSEVTANDIVNSMQRLCSAPSQAYGQLQGLIGCTQHAQGRSIAPQIQAIGKYKIKFNIDCSPSAFLFQLSSPNTVITKLTHNKLIGSGPYMTQEQNDDFLTLKPNNYYTGDVVIKNDGITLFYEGDRDVGNMLTTAKPDGALMYRMPAIWNLKNPDYKLVKTNPNVTEVFVLNNQKFPFNHLLLRQALAQEIYNNLDSSCIPSTHQAYGIIPTGIGGSLHNIAPSKLPTITPDEVFKEIPALSHSKIELTIQQFEGTKHICISNQIVRAAKKYNIDIHFKYDMDYARLRQLYLNHHLDGFVDLYIFKNREAYNILEFFEKNNENHANVNDYNIDQLLKNAISKYSSHERFQAYHALAQYMQNNAIVIPLFYLDHGNLMNKCLSGISEDFFFNPYSELPNISKTKSCAQY